MRKFLKQRKSGYYWVGWCYTGDGKIEERVAYYSDIAGVWLVPGEPRLFTDKDFISIESRAVKRRYSYPLHKRWIFELLELLVMAIFVNALLWFGVFIIKLLSK